MSYMSTQTFRTFKVMSDVFLNSLVSNSCGVEPPADALKITLRSHQQAALYRMEQLERSLVNGMDCSGETLYSSYGILGDSVGVGKSLMVLAHISRLATIPPLTTYMSMGGSSSNNVFSVKQSTHTDLSEAGSLIIVPHTLFRQWADYIKKQTNLKAIFLDKKKAIASETFTRDIMGADVVLVSNTQYKEFGIWQRDNQVRWKRLFVDEADTIHLVNGYPKPEARFTWFITASWMNILFVNETLYIQSSVLQNHLFNEDSQYKYLRPFFQDAYTSTRPYVHMRYGMTSYNFFRDTINCSHRLRGRLVMRCDDAFIQESISLPVLHRSNILCKAPLNQRIVSMAVPTEVQQLLHGGDIAGAISALGVKTESTTNLIEAVTKNLQKELTRLKATHTFKAGLEYSTSQGKEEALKSLEEKMKRAEDAIKTIQERIEGFKNEMCPICYDEPGEPLLTPCCSRIFCGQCILTCLTRNPACPMCRAEIPINRLTKVASTKDATAIVDSGAGGEPEEQLEKKSDALMRIFKENPQGRFLVFSRYDNPFAAIESSIEAIGVKVKQLKGNKDAVASTLRGFQSGDLRCLLLNSHYAGSGLNITAATHVILLHAMTHEEEKQILGRAYRMGRTAPLNFIRLLHADEMPTTN